MSTYKSYLTVKTTPNRKTRKGSRRDIFLANKKMAKVRKKAARLERKSIEVE